MPNQPAPPHPGGVTGLRAHARFLWRFACFAWPFWTTHRRAINRTRAAALILLTAAQVALQAGLNLWTAGLYDALQRRALDRFLTLILLFAALLGATMLVTALHLRVKRRLQFAWRVWVSRTALEGWMEAGRHYQLGLVPGDHDNPDGRIAEDIRITTESAIELGVSLLYCLMLLATFVGVLWSLSGTVHLPIGTHPLAIPGHLVWIALAYAAIGTTLALKAGTPLIGASYLRQSVEADFRFALAGAREHGEAIALAGGEPDERRRLLVRLRAVRDGWDQQTGGLTRIILFTSAYGVLASPLPVLIAAPRFILGLITLGTLMRTAQAFQQVAAALSWPVDNLATLAQWRASVERVLALRDALATLDATLGRHRIGRDTSDGALILTDLCVTTHEGKPLLGPLSARIAPGERVRLTGPPAAARTLIQAIAGLWPWGGGRIALPSGARLFVAAGLPYLPSGPLAAAVCYPGPSETCATTAIEDALRRAGLPELVPDLATAADWETRLTSAQQQRLAIARCLLARPDWICLADATSALDPADARALAATLRTALPGSAMIVAGTDAPAFAPVRTLPLAPERPRAVA